MPFVEKFFIARGGVNKHWSNVTHLTTPCSHVLRFDYQERCSFIQRTQECQHAVHYFDYLRFIFCTIGVHGAGVYIAGVLLVCLLCLILFTILSTTADKFFCPALAVISKTLKMSESVAGVTLLAFGNGSPDIFASLANSHGDTELMYTELLGAAAFVTGFVAGVIMIIRPFRIAGRNYVRDVLFFLLGALLINHFIHNQHYTLYEGFGTVFIYIAYLVVVVVDHILMKRKLEQMRQISSSNVSETESQKIEIQKETEQLEEMVEIQIKDRRDSSVILDAKILKAIQPVTGVGDNDDILKSFIDAITPIKRTDWRDGNFFSKAVMVMKAPVMFILLLIIPVVDYTEELHGWSKLLNMINIITLPQLFVFIIGNITTMFFDYVPLSAIVLLVSLGIALSVYFTSRNDCPPKYHLTFAAGSFIGSVLVIYTVAKEVVCVMKTFGIISNSTDSLIGLTILAWGNSVGDLFSNITLARQGYQQMAFAACFGGPLFNSLLGVGLTFIVKAFVTDHNQAFTREGAMGPNCILFLTCLLFFTLTTLSFTKYQARKSTGIYMIIIYSLFIFYALLGEFGVIHPYGTDHQRT